MDCPAGGYPPAVHHNATRIVPNEWSWARSAHEVLRQKLPSGITVSAVLTIPESNQIPYLDQRGIGLWVSSNLGEVKPAIWALDSMEAGLEGFKGRQSTRLRQFLLLQETRIPLEDAPGNFCGVICLFVLVKMRKRQDNH